MLGFWAEVVAAREANHAVFPSERVGAAGDAFTPCVSETDLLTPIGSIKEAWETAKRRANVKATGFWSKGYRCPSSGKSSVGHPQRPCEWLSGTDTSAKRRNGRVRSR